jgi:hypothetical protein
MGCLVLVSPTRGLGPAETSYSFQVQTPVPTKKKKERKEKKNGYTSFQISIKNIFFSVCIPFIYIVYFMMQGITKLQ